MFGLFSLRRNNSSKINHLYSFYYIQVNSVVIVPIIILQDTFSQNRSILPYSLDFIKGVVVLPLLLSRAN